MLSSAAGWACVSQGDSNLLKHAQADKVADPNTADSSGLVERNN